MRRAGIKETGPRRKKGTGGYSYGGVIVVCGSGKQYEHILIAEKALGRPLPPGAEVHHWDKDRWNNTPTNLVICPDHAYHMLIHKRMREAERKKSVPASLKDLFKDG